MKKKFQIIISIFAILVLLQVLSTISYGADKEVSFLILGDYTGPSGLTSSHVAHGLEDYLKYLNDKGGVEGIKINCIIVDTRYEVSRTVSAYKRFRMTPKLLAVNAVGTPITKAIAPLTKQDGLVQITTPDGEYVAKENISRYFAWGQTRQDEFGATMDWIVKDWKRKGKPGKPKVGYMDWDNAYGREPIKGGREYVEKLEINFLEPVFFPVGIPEHDIYLDRLRDADYIYGGGPEPQSPSMIRDAHRMGMTKKIQFICSYPGPTVNVGVKAYNEALQGTVISTWFLRGSDYMNHPLVKELWTTYRKRPMGETFPYYLMGISMGLNFEAALKIALKKVGYDGLGRDDLYEAYQKLTGMDTAQGMMGRCAYSPSERRASKEIRFYQVKGWDEVPITDWIIAPDTVSLYRGKW